MFASIDYCWKVFPYSTIYMVMCMVEYEIIFKWLRAGRWPQNLTGSVVRGIRWTSNVDQGWIHFTKFKILPAL